MELFHFIKEIVIISILPGLIYNEHSASEFKLRSEDMPDLPPLRPGSLSPTRLFFLKSCQGPALFRADGLKEEGDEPKYGPEEGCLSGRRALSHRKTAAPLSSSGDK